MTPRLALLLGLGFPILVPAWKAAEAAPPRPRIFAPGIISGPQDDASPAFSPDGKTVFFMRGGRHGGWTLMESHRIGHTGSLPKAAPSTDVRTTGASP